LIPSLFKGVKTKLSSPHSCSYSIE
jgi:hypothetical protein